MRANVGWGFLLVLLPAAAAAQNDCLKDLTMPEVGAWAEYQMQFKDKEAKTFRYAVVGSETRDGKAMKWLEVRMTGSKPDDNLIYQILTPGSPAEFDQAQEMIMKPGNRPAMKMNQMMMGMVRGQAQKNSALSHLCEGVTPAGEETVEVPAGSFKTLRMHNAKYDSDAWVSVKVPFYMVKMTGKDYTMALTKTGEGAKSSITETPQEMPGMGPAKKSQ
jgi:hypothetical protein